LIEARRVTIWGAVLTAVLGLTVARRLLGGTVMFVNSVYWPTVGVLLVATVCQAVLLRVLADVTGHGIGPAIVMAVCRAYARASASLLSEPAPLMRRLNELLHTDLPADRIITLAIAILDPSGRVELLSAGHGPSFLYHAATGEVRQFGGDGLPLGLSMAECYEPPVEFQMNAGDVLLLVTDGFHEYYRAGDGEQFGVARMKKAVIASADRQSATILQMLDQALRTFADGSLQLDDMTAVVIKRTADGAATQAAGSNGVSEPRKASTAAPTPCGSAP
jgi:serine phosphatase RsbU (regulator of sigma subunit)